MKRKNTILYRMSLLLISCISSISIIVLLCLNNGTMEYILSIISIAVTCILGITTYHQVEMQIKIDMIEKTPLFDIVFDGDEILDLESKGKSICNEVYLFLNKKFLCVGAYPNNSDLALLQLKIKNDSLIPIKKVDILYKKDESEKYAQIENYCAAQALKDFPNSEMLNTLNKTYKASPMYNVQPGEIIDFKYCVPFNAKTIESHFKLEIETVYGYRYEEIIDICATFIGYIEEKGLIYLVTKNNLSIHMKS